MLLLIGRKYSAEKVQQLLFRHENTIFKFKKWVNNGGSIQNEIIITVSYDPQIRKFKWCNSGVSVEIRDIPNYRDREVCYRLIDYWNNV
jgi:hypothetical protein